MKGVYDMLDVLFSTRAQRGRAKRDETHFNPAETLLPRGSVQVEPCDMASWQISFVKGRIAFGWESIRVISGVGSCDIRC
jgi:hypothetical protein